MRIFIVFLLINHSILADDLSKKVQGTLNTYCTDCHNAKKQKGKIRLDDFSKLPKLQKVEVLNRIEEQIYLEQMPPDDEDQPTTAERKAIFSTITNTFKEFGAKSNFRANMGKFSHANYVDHHKLFSGDYKDLKGFTYDRQWLISEYIFDAQFNRIFDSAPSKKIDGKKHYVLGKASKLTNPFLLPSNTGVRYYADVPLSGGQLLTMLGNAEKFSTHMVSKARSDKRKVKKPKKSKNSKKNEAAKVGSASANDAIKKMLAMEFQHAATLVSRKEFLEHFMFKICEDIYKGKNQALLPKFVSVLPTKEPKKDPKAKPAKINSQKMDHMYPMFLRTIRRVEQKGDTQKQIIAKCEKDWFYMGHREGTILKHAKFLKNFMKYVFKKKMRLVEYKDLSKSEMAIIRTAILKHRKKGDFYNQVIVKCMTEWNEGFKAIRKKSDHTSEAQISDLINNLFTKIYERSATKEELQKYTVLTKSYIKDMGKINAVKKLIQTLMLNTEIISRNEYGAEKADKYGRRMMSPRDASYALAYALSDSSPDKKLVEAVQNGKLSTKEDYQREVLRLLKNRDQYYIIDKTVENKDFTTNVTNAPIRKLRFFREFFGYPKMLSIFKDLKRFGGQYRNADARAVTEADMLVSYILENDKNVFEELLTTDKFYVYHSGDNKVMKAASEKLRVLYVYFKDMDWKNFKEADLIKHKDFIQKQGFKNMPKVLTAESVKKKGRRYPLRMFKAEMETVSRLYGKGQKYVAPITASTRVNNRSGRELRGADVAKLFGLKFDTWDYPVTQPAVVAKRKGILTHPAWLIAHAQNTATDPVIRGKWIREKLLAGTVPDVPITVDAVIPADPHKTLRARLGTVTKDKYCWKCHKQMNPLGNTFEMYDDFGRYRKEESLEYPENLLKKGKPKGGPLNDSRDIFKTLPVVTVGYLKGTGDDKLDGEVKDALDLIDRLGKSQKVRQSIIRHAFRYFLGRNEVLSDSKTLIEADQAYLKSGGSFDAVIVSLLTSDSFIYRKEVEASAL
jgi:hypothetical protein